MHRDFIAAGSSFCLNQELIPLGMDQQTAVSAGMLNSRAHETVDQFFQDHLTRNRLRDFKYRGQIQEFRRRRESARRRRDERSLFEMRIETVQLRYFAIGPPPLIAKPGFEQISVC